MVRRMHSSWRARWPRRNRRYPAPSKFADRAASPPASLCHQLMLGRLARSPAHILLISTTRLALPCTRLFTSSAYTMAPTPWDPKATPYPSVRRDENFVDTFKSQEKGEVKVADPYHWLHEPDSEETKRFVEAQGEHARAYLDQYQDADKLKKEITANYDYPRCKPTYPTRPAISADASLPARQSRAQRSRGTASITSRYRHSAAYYETS